MATVKRRTRTQAKPERARDVPRSPLVLAWNWRQENGHLFSSDTGLRWHLRKHRDAYVAAGALLEIGGRLFVDPPKFEAVLREVGQRVAAERSAEPQAAA
jgi:hypothetical protein